VGSGLGVVEGANKEGTECPDPCERVRYRFVVHLGAAQFPIRLTFNGEPRVCVVVYRFAYVNAIPFVLLHWTHGLRYFL